MKFLFLFLSLSFISYADDFVEKVSLKSDLWGAGRIENINLYNENFAPFFVNWQSNHYFSMLAIIALLAVITAFVIHYLIIGPKTFSHDGKKILAFKSIERLVHLAAAISWIILVPTGLILMFGDTFGGGFFVRFCKNLHGIATIIFAISLLPMFCFWLKRMLPVIYDIKWFMIVGGYLSKNKKPVPAGKFNAGQKAWFWVATAGGAVMICTGAAMFFLDFDLGVATFFGLSQVEILRLSAIIHNILGAVCATFLMVHIYMAVFAIKGSIHSMITGFKEEEEVFLLHHFWYKELLQKGKIQKSEFENKYLA